MTATASPFLEPSQMLAQLRAHGEVTLLDGRMQPRPAHYRDIRSLTLGTIARRYYLEVETAAGCYLLPVVLDDRAEAEALYQQARAAYRERA